jgi:hypothetical protein
MSLPQKIVWQFSVASWSETAFHEMPEAGKLSRASITNTFSGALDGLGTLEYLFVYPITPADDVLFSGYERVVATLGNLQGSFVLKHEGVYSPTAGVGGSLTIVTNSGTGDFSGVKGQGNIIAKAGEHGGSYALQIENQV